MGSIVAERALPTRFWLWPNLLSLDAPVVAVLWQIFFARSFRVPVDPVAALLLLLTVWLIYVADRTLDGWRQQGQSPRHRFYRLYWRRILPVWLLALGVCGWLAVERLPAALFRHGLILLLAVGVYFWLVHAGRLRLPKEMAVGVLFAMGTSLGAWGQVKTPADVVTILLFSGLCWINCVAIERWEAGERAWSPRVAASLLAGVAGVLLFAHRPVLGGAELASAFGFLLLGLARTRLSLNALRVLADVALLSPALFLSAIR